MQGRFSAYFPPHCFSGPSLSLNISDDFTPPNAHQYPCACLHFSMGMAKFLPPAIRPSVEGSLAACGNELLDKMLFTRSTQMYLYTGVRSTCPMSISKRHLPIQLPQHQRFTIRSSRFLDTLFWCRVILTTVSSETRI